ncbi:hypothetical protein ES706_00150 [subsurface metagenome]|nr:hypothetical protein [Hadesarchaea archaeon]
MIAGTESENGNKIWKKFLRNHWKMVVLFIVGAILASIGATLVCLWVVGEVQLAGLIPATLGLWSMGHLVTFLLRLVFWEVLLIGVPVILAAVAIIFLWWKKLPDRERKEYRRGHLFGTRSRTTNGRNVISPLVFIVFCIKVFLDGNWNVAFGTWTFDYVVYSFLWALIWVLIIFGIPMVLGGTWWIRHEMKKKP